MLQTRVVEKIKTHTLCSVTFLKKSCHIRDNVEKCGTVRQAKDDTICVIQGMHFACWITLARHTFVIFNTHCFSTATIVS